MSFWKEELVNCAESYQEGSMEERQPVRIRRCEKQQTLGDTELPWEKIKIRSEMSL